MNNSKNIYIVFTFTGTILSRIVKLYTKEEYSHISISLDEELKEMYSFGRINPYNPFIGGFVKEGINKGTFKRFKNTKAAIYSLKLTEEQYDKIVCLIKKMKRKKKIYKFNFIGLCAVSVNYKYKKDNYFYCAEFIKYLFDNADIKNDIPDIVKPMDFEELKKLKLVYEGYLREYNK